MKLVSIQPMACNTTHVAVQAVVTHYGIYESTISCCRFGSHDTFQSVYQTASEDRGSCYDA